MATSPGVGGYSWEFLVGCATWFFKSDFRPKNVIFHTRFQTRTIKFIPIFRPSLKAEIMLSLLRLECKQKKIFKPILNSHTTLSFLLIWEWNHKYFHTLCSFLENHTRFQTKMSKVYTCFQTKTAQKPYPMGRHIPTVYSLCKGVPTPGATRLPLSSNLSSKLSTNHIHNIQLYSLHSRMADEKGSTMELQRCQPKHWLPG